MKKKNKKTIKQIKNNKIIKIRRIIVIVFLTLFAINSYIVMRGSYLEYKRIRRTVCTRTFNKL